MDAAARTRHTECGRRTHRSGGRANRPELARPVSCESADDGPQSLLHGTLSSAALHGHGAPRPLSNLARILCETKAARACLHAGTRARKYAKRRTVWQTPCLMMACTSHGKRVRHVAVHGFVNAGALGPQFVQTSVPVCPAFTNQIDGGPSPPARKSHQRSQTVPKKVAPEKQIIVAPPDCPRWAAPVKSKRPIDRTTLPTSPIVLTGIVRRRLRAGSVAHCGSRGTECRVGSGRGRALSSRL